MRSTTVQQTELCSPPLSDVCFRVCGACPQIISGVSVGAYWMSTFVFDVVTYVIPCAVFLGLIYAFDVPSESLGITLYTFYLLFVVRLVVW